MMELPVSASQQELFDALKTWVEALAENDYERAKELLYWPEWGQEFPLESMKQLITNYGTLDPREDGQTFRVTDPNSAKGRAHHSVAKFTEGADGVVGHVCYDLPLNGEWSQVTATFDLCRIGDRLVFVLEDIHVL